MILKQPKVYFMVSVIYTFFIYTNLNGQNNDYIIIGQDTIPTISKIQINRISKEELCFALLAKVKTDNYNLFCQVKNDSLLFLFIKIISKNNLIDSVFDIAKIQNTCSSNLFFDDTIYLKTGKYIRRSSSGNKAIYDKERVLIVKNSKIISDNTYQNIEVKSNFIPRYNIVTVNKIIIDTLNKMIDWKKLTLSSKKKSIKQYQLRIEFEINEKGVLENIVVINPQLNFEFYSPIISSLKNIGKWQVIKKIDNPIREQFQWNIIVNPKKKKIAGILTLM